MFLQFLGKNIVLLTGLISWFALPSTAQVTPDNSTSTTVINNGTQTTIDNGDRAGDNLFHSFRDFSVPNGGEAFFNNANDIVNIFSRVTGGNISNIDGLLRANGGANLFLINPAGILFGNNARLDIGGSFYGTSADSILFEDGEFSATDLENPPLLTINAPIGLNFRDDPGDITVRGSNLAVNSGQSLNLIGGNLRIQEGAILTGFGGKVQLGGVRDSGIVNFDENLNFDFPETLSLADVTLSDNVAVNVSANNGGEISLFARNLALTNNSSLIAGIAENRGSPNARAGDITIAASGDINLDGNSVIFNQVENNGEGNGGNVDITANSLILNNRSSVGGRTAGIGNSGDVNLNVADKIEVNGLSSLRSLVEETAMGNSGDININTGVLRVSNESNFNFVDDSNRSLIFANTRGVGNGGNITINASESVTLTAKSSLLSQVLTGATGNSGNVTINTPSLAVRDFSLVLTNTGGIGNAGNININANDSLVIDRRSSISAGTTNQGNAGNINVTTNSLSLSNFALLSANTRNNANGTAGQIIVEANNVSVSQGAIIGSFTETDFGFAGGTIEINAETLDVTAGGNILTGSDGRGNAGDINLNVSSRLTIDGSNPAEFPPEFPPFQDPILQELESTTGLLASTTAEATGNGGNININTEVFTIENNAQISVNSQGLGNGGVISIDAGQLNLEEIASISAATSSGQGGEIGIDLSDNLRLSNNSTITAQAFNNADGGNIRIDANFLIAFPGVDNGSDIIANAQQGNGGNITITTEAIFGLQEQPAESGNETNDIDASSDFGLSGNVVINTPDVDATQGVVELSSNVVEEKDTVSTSCASDRRENSSSLTIKGKGGILPQPTDEFFVENIAIDGKLASERETLSSSVQSVQYPPILTSKGAIYPARGVVVKPDGSIILTRYPTDNLDRRVISASKNCANN